jgi:hypothetical protein
MNPWSDYPRTFVVRNGRDTGKVMIQWGPRGETTLVSPDGTAEQVFRAPTVEMTKPPNLLKEPDVQPSQHVPYRPGSSGHGRPAGWMWSRRGPGTTWH